MQIVLRLELSAGVERRENELERGLAILLVNVDGNAASVVGDLDAAVVEQTLGAVVKHYEDLELLRDETMLALLGRARAAAA
jgi:hypothetical protein